MQAQKPAVPKTPALLFQVNMLCLQRAPIPLGCHHPRQQPDDSPPPDSVQQRHLYGCCTVAQGVVQETLKHPTKLLNKADSPNRSDSPKQGPAHSYH